MLSSISKNSPGCKVLEDPNDKLFLCKIKDIRSLQTQLIDSDSTFGITNHFPDSTEKDPNY